MCLINLARILKFDRSTEDPIDIRQLYIAGQLYHDGMNPYNDSLLKQRWQENMVKQELTFNRYPGGPENYMLYPPHTASWFSAIEGLPWLRLGNWVWIFAILCVTTVSALLFFNYPREHKYRLLLILFGFKGTAIAILLGQPVLAALVFIAFAYLLENKRPLLSGLLYAFAALKPSIALPFFLHLVAEKKWKNLIAFIITGLFLQIPVLLHFKEDTPKIYLSWLGNMHIQTLIPYSTDHQFLAGNLTSPFITLFQLTGFDFSPALPYLLLGSFLITLYLRLSERISENYALMILLLSSFMFSYHLFYDLILLSFFIPEFAKWRLWGKLILFSLFLPLNYLFGFLNLNAIAVMAVYLLCWIESDAFGKRSEIAVRAIRQKTDIA